MRALTDSAARLAGILALLLAAGSAAAAGIDHRLYRLQLRSQDYRLRQPAAPAPAAAALRQSALAASRQPALAASRQPALAARIERQARARGLDPALVHAVIRAESAYRPDAVSPKGAIGLMQVMPATGRRFGVADLTSPDANLAAGTAYLDYLLDRFRDLPLALAAYNAGEGAVIRHGYRVPPYAETRAYVRSVLRNYAGKDAGRTGFAATRLDSGIDFSAYRLRPGE